MKNRATEFFKNYFKIHADEIDIYDETIDCMTKFAESELNPDVSKMSYYDLINLFDDMRKKLIKIDKEIERRNASVGAILRNEFYNQQLDNETDAAGNCFSDADCGL